jgi:hypothetical protein
MSLSEYINHINSLIDMEMNEAKKLESPKLDQLLQYVGIDWVPDDIYFNRTNIMFTDREEYDKLKEFCKQCADILKLELVEFNQACFIVNYVNCEQLTNMFEGEFNG